MINFNGSIVENDTPIFLNENRGFKYGDGLFETIKVIDKTILFWEDHYFRLMASMRILRMEIPMNFTMEFLESEILKTLDSNELKIARVRLDVFRGNGGGYMPFNNTVSYLISATKISNADYTLKVINSSFRVDLFKDYYVNPGLLSTLKSTDKLIHILGSIYADENDLDGCLLLNTEKSVVEATNANLFLVKGNIIKTPPPNDGCLKGVMRKQVIELIKKDAEYELEESSISSFELQKADELFLTNAIMGIKSITDYRKKHFNTVVANTLRMKLNKKMEMFKA